MGVSRYLPHANSLAIVLAWFPCGENLSRRSGVHRGIGQIPFCALCYLHDGEGQRTTRLSWP